jgi:PPOX class probable F420-dependent enzyme
VAELPEAAKKLLDEPQLAHFVTLMKDGSPQVTPVWVTHDGTHVIVNTAEGRQKPRNLRRDPRVAVSVVDKNNPFRYVLVRGRVGDIVGGEEAWQSIEALSQKYNGRAYPRREGEQRLMIKIAPEHVTVRSPE